MQDINLISQTSRVDQTVTKKTNSLSSSLKILIILLVIATLTTSAVYAIVYFRLKGVRDEHAKLKQELAALEKSEQRFILLRDRLDKVSKIQSQYNTKDEIKVARDLTQNIQPPSQLTSVNITPDAVETEITTDSSLNIAKVFSYLISSGNYTRVSMLSFDYNPASAYRVNLQIIK